MHKPRVMQRLLSHRYDTGIVLNQEQVISLIPLMYVHMTEVLRAMFLPCARAQATGSGSLAMRYALAHVQVSSSLLSLIVIDAWSGYIVDKLSTPIPIASYVTSIARETIDTHFSRQLNRSFLPFIRYARHMGKYHLFQDIS